jgi:hypothetical protein
MIKKHDFSHFLMVLGFSPRSSIFGAIYMGFLGKMQ